jgi:hypothetical protein
MGKYYWIVGGANNDVMDSMIWWIGSLATVAALKVEEPILDTLRFRTTKESELDMKKI